MSDIMLFILALFIFHLVAKIEKNQTQLYKSIDSYFSNINKYNQSCKLDKNTRNIENITRYPDAMIHRIVNM